MNSSLRNFHARNLYDNIDSWLAQRLSTESLTLVFEATGPIEIWHNDELVVNKRIETMLIKHSQVNVLRINAKQYKILNFKIDNFDCLPILTFDHGQAQLEFTKPFAIWFTEATRHMQDSSALLDSVLYRDNCNDLEQQIVAKLQQLKF